MESESRSSLRATFCLCHAAVFFVLCVFFTWTAASRRSRNRIRGQLLVKNSKGTTLKFESDFDFETANAQFNDDITKEDLGVS